MPGISSADHTSTLAQEAESTEMGVATRGKEFGVGAKRARIIVPPGARVGNVGRLAVKLDQMTTRRNYVRDQISDLIRKVQARYHSRRPRGNITLGSALRALALLGIQGLPLVS
jgi:hypothetical protein